MLNGFAGLKLEFKLCCWSISAISKRTEIRLEGELAAAELDFGLRDEMIRAEQPLRYDLAVEKLDDALLVTGSLELRLDCQCVRCLKAFKQRLVLEDWACHLPLTGEEKVSVNNDCVDLTPFLREDILLEFPQHPHCKADCGGLKKNQAPKDRRQGQIRVVRLG